MERIGGELANMCIMLFLTTQTSFGASTKLTGTRWSGQGAQSSGNDPQNGAGGEDRWSGDVVCWTTVHGEDSYRTGEFHSYPMPRLLTLVRHGTESWFRCPLHIDCGE